MTRPTENVRRSSSKSALKIGISPGISVMSLLVSLFFLGCFCSNISLVISMEASGKNSGNTQSAATSISQGIMDSIGGLVSFGSSRSQDSDAGMFDAKKRRRPSASFDNSAGNFSRKIHSARQSRTGLRQPNGMLAVRYNVKLGQRQDSVFQYPRGMEILNLRGKFDRKIVYWIESYVCPSHVRKCCLST